MEILAKPDAWIALLTLTILEIVLGIDNIVFVSILCGKLPEKDRERARKLGMTLAIIPRLLLLTVIGLIVKATEPFVTLHFLEGIMKTTGMKPEAIHHAIGVSAKDVIMLIGGLFLIYKSVKEIHHKLEGADDDIQAKGKSQFAAVIMSILWINVIFSLDSVITAVGMTKYLPVMIAAVVISGIFMIVYSKFVSNFVEKHPTIKILALSFLVLIGTNLIAEGCGVEIPKGYTYFAMAFAVIVEIINIRVRAKGKPVALHEPEYPEDAS